VLDDLLLDADQFGIADLHRQVAAGDHHAVAGADQLIQGVVVGYRLGTFDLGDQPGITTGFLQQLAGVVHVGGIARKGHRHIVQVQLGGQLDVAFVLVGQRRRGEPAALAVDALVVGQRAADQYPAAQFVATDTLHLHYHPAIVEQQLVADLAVLDQVGIVDTYHLLGTGIARVTDGKTEVIAGGQLDAFLGKAGNADLRALQVAQQSHMAPGRGSQLADQTRPFAVLIGTAVGEVQACHIQTRMDQGVEGGWGVAGRAEGGDDLAATKGHARLQVQECSEATPS